MSKTIVSSKKLIETFSDSVKAVEFLSLQKKIRDFSLPDLEINFNNAGVEFMRGSGEFNFTRDSTATYIDTDGLMKRSNPNEPRVEQNGLLIEGPSRNYIKNSQYFNGKLLNNVTVVADNNFASPNPDFGSQYLRENATESTHYIEFNADNNFEDSYAIQANSSGGLSSSSAINKILTFSIFVVVDSRSFVKLEHLDPISAGGAVRSSAVFNIANGTIVSSSTNFNTSSYTNEDGFYLDDPNNPVYAKIVSIGQAGWKRISLTTFTGQETGQPRFRLSVSPDGTTFSYLGNSSSAIKLWGAQLEPMPYATSYIYSPVGATSISTRAADICWISNALKNVAYPNSNMAYIADFDLLGRYHPISWDYTGKRYISETGQFDSQSLLYPYLTCLQARDIFDASPFKYNAGRILPDANLVSLYQRDWSTYAGVLDNSIESNNLFESLIRASFTYSASHQKVYINGRLKVADMSANYQTYVAPENIYLGQSKINNSDFTTTNSAPNNWLNGHIYSFRIFKRELDQHELMLL